ncbi:MAG: DNA mismatch repair endonuclease MutL [Candidatus Heimdallarchaeota archaeon]|nr:MAG: DNA mismatch repair endonuclease MutL [Candidatus Heimdallarchaeota archaeon]
MSKIQMLDPVCVSKIAAGEVIERPASVVKELIENAIDASATDIRIEIKNGGKDLIEIIDNGTGILPEDIPLTIKRHATSKISSEKDLESISTMGFRGEALYSIASVSRFSIVSRTAENELATRISVENDMDQPQISEEVMASPGTRVRVQDLFFNFIVRRKFLKKASIEQSYIYETVTQYAIGHPIISFTYVIDGKIEFQTVKSDNHLSAIKETLGQDLAGSLIDIGIIQRKDILIHGYLSKQGQHRRNRKYQYFYINGRRIFSKILQTALEEGYGSYLMKREFPAGFLFLELDPIFFDVNIHPQKREVLFYNEKDLTTAITSTVNHCLKTKAVVPHLTSHVKRKRQSNLIFEKSDMKKTIKQQVINLQPEVKPLELSNHLQDQFEVINERPEMISFLGSNLIYRGPLGKEFLLLEDTSNHDLIVLDFHAAHERVNLEKLTKMYKTRKVSSQTFLKPFRFSITPEQKILLMDSLPYLSAMGFDFRSPKGKKQEIEVYAIPSILIKSDLKDFLVSLIDSLPKTAIEEQIKTILNLIACHGSYRAGDTLSFQQTKNLLQELLQAEDSSVCAHGRPIYFKLSYHEFLKQVRRI